MCVYVPLILFLMDLLNGCQNVNQSLTRTRSETEDRVTRKETKSMYLPLSTPLRHF